MEAVSLSFGGTVVQQFAEKVSECFESLSMNGKTPMISKFLRSS
jgi:hypothetical protein